MITERLKLALAELGPEIDTWINDQVLNNSFLVAGAFGVAYYALRNVPRKIYAFIKYHSVTSVSVSNSDMEIFRSVCKWLEDHPYTKKRCRNLQIEKQETVVPTTSYFWEDLESRANQANLPVSWFPSAIVTGKHF